MKRRHSHHQRRLLVDQVRALSACPPDFTGGRGLRPNRRHRRRIHQNGRQEPCRRAHCRPDSERRTGQPRPGLRRPAQMVYRPATTTGKSSPSATASCMAAITTRQPTAIDTQVLDASEQLRPAGPAAPAAQRRRHPRPAGPAPPRAADRLLRHCLPSQPAGCRPDLRPAALDHRRRRQALRLPRPVLRVHRPRPAATLTAAPTAVSSSPTSATAPAWRPWSIASASPRHSVSRPSTAWSWAPVAAISTPVSCCT